MEKNKKNAILSVFDKTGIVEFAQELVSLDWKIFSSSGTARVLHEGGIPVTDVSKITGLAPILDHRVATLAPQIHGGLLAMEKHLQELKKLGYPWIDLVCVDLYPLKEEICRPGATLESVLEKTDIGGPTLLRSGAKGRRIVVIGSSDRERVIEWLKNGEPNAEEFRNALAAKAEAIAADYSLESARFRGNGNYDGIIGHRVVSCKYGENPWQTPAALFAQETNDSLALQNFKLVEGSDPSYINWCDIDRLLQTITHIAAVFEQNHNNIPFIAVGAKHGNACGASVATDAGDALRGMIDGDPLALFGGLVMTNFPISGQEAKLLREWNTSDGTKRILDGVLAPSFSKEARLNLSRKGGKCRLLENSALENLGMDSLDVAPRFRYVRGGFLRQPNYTYVLDLKDPDLEIVGHTCSESQKTDLLLACAVGSTSNSNTITLVKNGAVIGNGVGQKDRVGAATLAIAGAKRSGHDIRGAVAYSDSFFPFPDGPQILIEAGVQVIFTSKGSVKDEATREVCREAEISLYFLPDSRCRGFFGH
ncbi:MAG TPA: hypothetical protein ENH86_00330 [Candidatus Jorgensenbacteria bacterium]|uniref:MGS-like domain-containing protein n=1 Tax=marine sediment metagenome TaxID=412755 RepID=A0A0F9N9P8_9ZZZZ|nr:hypothetical protein [Candidatus Jorgensenbacteria bacterium]